MTKEIKIFKKNLDELCLLNHDFYKVLWNKGLLSQDDLQHYSEQYYFIEKNFLDCLFIMQKKYTDKKKFIQIINENIFDELGGGSSENSHLNLWIKFAEFFNSNEKKISKTKKNKETQELVNKFQLLAEESLPSAIGALYAYENQIPSVAKSKIEGLIKHYKATKNGQEILFFKEHQKLDVWHTKQWEKIIKKFTTEELTKFKEAAIESAKLLLKFLDGVMENRKLQYLCTMHSN